MIHYYETAFSRFSGQKAGGSLCFTFGRGNFTTCPKVTFRLPKSNGYWICSYDATFCLFVCLFVCLKRKKYGKHNQGNYSHDDTLIHSQFPTDSPAFVYSTIPTLPDINIWDTDEGPNLVSLCSSPPLDVVFCTFILRITRTNIETGRGSPVATVPRNLSRSVAVPSP